MEDGVGKLAADVVEINVDAGRADFLELRHVVRYAAIVECGVKTKVFGDVQDFFLAAGDSHDAAAAELRNLADD